jgi:phosphoribosylformylglycinamidine (FGAM) synthase-like enzyme
MRIVLADEISPDNCRLWDVKTNEKMDKDRFRRDLGKVEEAYQEVARRLGILPEAGRREPTMTELGIFSVMWSRALLLQVLARHLKKLPTGPPGSSRARARTPASSTSATARRHLQDGEPQPPELHRALSGRGDRRRRHPARRLHHGRAPDRLLNALRFGDPERPRPHLVAAWSRHRRLRQLHGRADRRRRDQLPPGYNGNILVNAMTVGSRRADKIFYSAAAGIGNPVVYVGSKTGRDGIHGATMASAEFDDEIRREAPDRAGRRSLHREAAARGLPRADGDRRIVAIQDMGAAGLTSSSVEMAVKGGVGIELDLDKVPMRETGMTAYEMMLSESQERMLMVLKPGREAKARAIFEKWELDFAVIGKLTDTGRWC